MSDVVVGQTAWKGRGLFTTSDISCGSVVVSMEQPNYVSAKNSADLLDWWATFAQEQEVPMDAAIFVSCFHF